MQGPSLSRGAPRWQKETMPLSQIANVFTGNPLDRASERRPDSAWLDEKLEAADSLAVALWNGAPLVEKKDDKVQLSYIPADMAQELSGGWERLLFLGLWKETAVFALDLEGGADPAEGPLQGMGRFQDLRAIAMALPGNEAAIAATARNFGMTLGIALASSLDRAVGFRVTLFVASTLALLGAALGGVRPVVASRAS